MDWKTWLILFQLRKIGSWDKSSGYAPKFWCRANSTVRRPEHLDNTKKWVYDPEHLYKYKKLNIQTQNWGIVKGENRKSGLLLWADVLPRRSKLS